jgi:hypothetical protein
MRYVIVKSVMRWGRKDTANYFIVFAIFFIINLVTTGGHLDMWDSVVTYMITESMALIKTAQLHPQIPTISSANTNDIVNTMQEYEIGNYKAITGKYQEWVLSSKPVEAVYSSRSLLLGAIAIILATFFLRNRKMDFYVYS